MQNHVQQRLEVTRFADRLSHLIVHDQLGAQAANALAGSADHGEEDAHGRQRALALHVVERRLGETQNPGVSRRNRRGRPRFLVQERHLTEIIARLEHRQSLVNGAGGLSALLNANAAVHNEIHAVAGVSLGEDGFAIAILLLLQGGSEAGERIVVHALEHGDVFEFLGIHGASPVWRVIEPCIAGAARSMASAPAGSSPC